MQSAVEALGLRVLEYVVSAHNMLCAICDMLSTKVRTACIRGATECVIKIASIVLPGATGTHGRVLSEHSCLGGLLNIKLNGPDILF